MNNERDIHCNTLYLVPTIVLLFCRQAPQARKKFEFDLSRSHNKSSGKKILNTTFYPDQKGINKFIKGKSELKGNKQVY